MERFDLLNTFLIVFEKKVAHLEHCFGLTIVFQVDNEFVTLHVLGLISQNNALLPYLLSWLYLYRIADLFVDGVTSISKSLAFRRRFMLNLVV